MEINLRLTSEKKIIGKLIENSWLLGVVFEIEKEDQLIISEKNWKEFKKFKEKNQNDTKGKESNNQWIVEEETCGKYFKCTHFIQWKWTY